MQILSLSESLECRQLPHPIWRVTADIKIARNFRPTLLSVFVRYSGRSRDAWRDHLTAPKVSPLIRLRWNTMMNRTTGRIISTAEADRFPQAIVWKPTNP